METSVRVRMGVRVRGGARTVQGGGARVERAARIAITHRTNAMLAEVAVHVPPPVCVALATAVVNAVVTVCTGRRGIKKAANDPILCPIFSVHACRAPACGCARICACGLCMERLFLPPLAVALLLVACEQQPVVKCVGD